MELFSLAHAFYETLHGHCTCKTCPTLRLPSGTAISWNMELIEWLKKGYSIKEVGSKSPASPPQAAPMVIDLAISWVDRFFENPPAGFQGTMSLSIIINILSLAIEQLRVVVASIYLILYHCLESHHGALAKGATVDHLTALTRHLVLFARQFKLIKSSDLDAISKFY